MTTRLCLLKKSNHASSQAVYLKSSFKLSLCTTINEVYTIIFIATCVVYHYYESHSAEGLAPVVFISIASGSYMYHIYSNRMQAKISLLHNFLVNLVTLYIKIHYEKS